jgi:D-sedoheptulose 7-phosphate isomerase
VTDGGSAPEALSAHPRPEPAAVREAFARRDGPGHALADAADTITRACHDMAVRFHAGGKLIVFGNGASATDAEHIAVEFAHPVIVGKAALPALSLTDDTATLTAIAVRDGFEETFAAQIRLLGRPEDIALGLSADGRCPNVLRGLAEARRSGLLTIALTGGGGGRSEPAPAVDHLVAARSDDPCVIKEMHVTAYHIMWELVHVLAEQPDLLEVTGR